MTTVAYATPGYLADRQQIYRFIQPDLAPITEWLFDLAGGPDELLEPVVDVGTGGGQYLDALSSRKRVGLDLSSGMLAALRRQQPDLPLACADVQSVPLADGSAGTLLANHMLYHVPDIAKGVAELRRVLQPKGLLLVVTNGIDHLAELAALRDQVISQLAGQPSHLDTSGKRFTLENGEQHLRRYFRSVECHHRRAELVVPDPEPVLRYLASQESLAPLLPDGITFDAVLQAAEPMLVATIKTEGHFRVRIHAGAFVCHD